MIQMKLFLPQGSSFTSELMRPVRRVDVSHRPSPGLPRVNGGCGTSRYGFSGNGFCWDSAAFTLPAMRSVYSADHLQTAVPSQHYAHSESFRNTRSFMAGRFGTQQLPRRPMYELDPLDDVFLPSNPQVCPLRSEHHQMFLERQKLQRSLSLHQKGQYGSQDLSWLVRDGRERQEATSRRPSQTAVLVNAEAKTNGTVLALEPEINREAKFESLK